MTKDAKKHKYLFWETPIRMEAHMVEAIALLLECVHKINKYTYKEVTLKSISLFSTCSSLSSCYNFNSPPCLGLPMSYYLAS